MTGTEAIIALLIGWTAVVIIAENRLREWWTELHRTQDPEYRQGTPVDRTLWHILSDTGTPWEAGSSWEHEGRGFTVALIRQGLGRLLNENRVSSYEPIYCLGYTVREEADRKQLEAMEKRLERMEEKLHEQRQEAEELRQALAQRPRTAPQQHRNTGTPMEEALEQWGRSPASMEEIMTARGWQRIPPPAQIVTQSEETGTDYANLTGDERKATMAALKDEGKSYTEIAALFGAKIGTVKSTISAWRNRTDSDGIGRNRAESEEEPVQEAV